MSGPKKPESSGEMTCREAGKRGGRPTKQTDLSPKNGDWSTAFLAMMRETGNVWRSAEAAGVTRQACYHRRDRDEEFRAAWADAADEACDRLEDVGRKRAEESSDVLLIFFLKSLRPDVYQDRSRLDVLFGKMPDDQLDAYIQQRLAEAGSGGEDRNSPPALTAGGEEE